MSLQHGTRGMSESYHCPRSHLGWKMSLWSHHYFEKTAESNNLVLAKIELQELKDDFKKGVNDGYFFKSETSFWHGVAYET